MRRQLDSRQTAEVNFWSQLFLSKGVEGYKQHRRNDYHFITELLPEVHREEGKGLDIGCGVLSIFEFSPKAKNVSAADFLLPEYDQIYKSTNPNVTYQYEDGEALTFPDNTFDWIFCANTIDHTPHPEKMLSEFRRVLKPGKNLYFWVNFDPALSPPHYFLWNQATVDTYLKEWKLLKGIINWHDDPNWDTKYCYWAIYRNQK